MLAFKAQESTAPRKLETGVSKEHFLTDDWFERDLEAVFRPRWHYAGHISELPVPGSFIVFTLGRDEAVITRKTDLSLAAYHNFCPHRGHRLCTTDRGHLNKHFVCPYHAWVYSKDDGACLSATRMEKDFDRSPYGLKTAWVEDFNGMIFVSFADQRPQPVAEKTAHLLTPGTGIAGYDVRRMKSAAIVYLDFHANWKVVRENDDECYHCTVNHPELVQGYDPWHGFTVVEDLDSPQHIWTSDEWALIELGHSYNAPRVCQVNLPRCDGSDGENSEEAQFFFQPGGHILLQRDNVWIWTIRPVSPDRTLVIQQWLVAETAEQGKDYQVEDLINLFDVTIRQDMSLCQEVQRGLGMRRYTPGPLNPRHQPGAGAFYHWYQQCLAASG